MGRRKKVSHGDDSSDEEGNHGVRMEPFGITDQDLIEESGLFNEPDRRRGRKFTKEDAIYGIWAERGSDDEDDTRQSGRHNTANLLAGPRFVKGTTSASQAKEDHNVDDSSDDNGGDMDAPAEEDGDSDRDLQSREMELDDEEEEEHRGLGMREFDDAVGDSRPGLGSVDVDAMEVDEDDLRPALGTISGGARAGIGSKPAAGSSQGGSTGPSAPKKTLFSGSSSTSTQNTQQLPTTFGKRKFEQTKAPTPAKSTPRAVPDKDFGKFEKTTKGFGSKYLAKFGYKPGQGLGREREGIVKPIDVKLRPTKMGLGHGGFDERTETVKDDQRRRAKGSGDVVMEEASKAEKKAPRTDGWKKNKKSKDKYRTAVQILKDAEEDMVSTAIVTGLLPTDTVSAAPSQSSKIIDMTGKQTRVLSDAKDIQKQNQIGLVDHSQRIPEFRHNIGLLAEMAQEDLTSTYKKVKEKERSVNQTEQDEKLMRGRYEASKEVVTRLEAVLELARECGDIAVDVLRSISPAVLAKSRRAENGSASMVVDSEDSTIDFIGPFRTVFEKLQGEYYDLYVEHHLDELTVAALSPIMKRLLSQWYPLLNPTFTLAGLKSIKKLLIVETQLSKARAAEEVMTAFESMMYTIWMVKIRQAINNDWDVRHPDAVIVLLEAWCPPKPIERAIERTGENDGGFFIGNERRPQQVLMDLVAENRKSERSNGQVESIPSSDGLLPLWLVDNIIDQLVLPKISRTLDDWDPRRSQEMVHTWLHPWLTILEEDRMEHYINTPVRQKLGIALSSSSYRLSKDGGFMRKSLLAWKDVFNLDDLDSLIIKHVLPKLVEVLRLELEINPAKQDIVPFHSVLEWLDLFDSTRRGLFVHLFETEFFPKWNQTLWTWLTGPIGEGSLDERRERWGATQEEVMQWYMVWKSQFPETLMNEEGIQRQFIAAMDMMQTAMDWREQNEVVLAAAQRVGGPWKELPPPPMPSLPPPIASIPASTPVPTVHSAAVSTGPSVTVKELLESSAAENNLSFLPTHRTHPVSGKPLFKIGGTGGLVGGATGGGLQVYIDQSVVFVQISKGKWEPKSVRDTIEMAAALSGKRSGRS
ncbi:GC-rich sequence DNA-binding factor-like protein-domain-containing protein [Cladochytrium replicatum]|nr:GC-rich sequence DNA-binding factor-like protein-domain-containing protein [Cladochytrium replicatum]